MPEAGIIIEIIGEGKTDRGRGSEQPEPPTTGVVPILVHRLCDRPEAMLIRKRPLPFLQGKGLWQKVRFAKRQAFGSGSAGLVYVLDTEGNHPGQLQQLQRGRDSELHEYPVAVGVAHPCVEAWLLVDASAIARAMTLSGEPEVPFEPESLPAPCRDRSQNPKAVLARCAGTNRSLSSAESSRITREIRSLDTIRVRCPIGFAPFADEVLSKIRPLFKASEDEPEVP